MLKRAFIFALALISCTSIPAQNCRSQVDCSSGRCLATVRCENGQKNVEAPPVEKQRIVPTIPPPAINAKVNEETPAPNAKSDVNRTDIAKLLLAWYRLLPYSDKLNEEIPPDVGYSGHLNESQARWCIYESVRLNSIRGMTTNAGVNSMLTQHKELCGQAKILGSIEQQIVAELTTSRPTLNLQGSLIKDVVSGKISDFVIPYRYFEGTTIVEHDRYYRQFRSIGDNISCKKMQEAGNTEGNFCLYWLNRSKETDSIQKYLVSASDLGHVPSIYEYAFALDTGRGVVKDSAKANQLFEKAAVLGFPRAMVTVGWRLMSEEPKDYVKAYKWNLEASKKGHAEGAANLGMLYENGWGVKENYVEAATWYQKAIDISYGSSGQAEERLAWLYQNGLGVKRDEKRAKELYRKVLLIGRSTGDRKQFATTQLASLSSGPPPKQSGVVTIAHVGPVSGAIAHLGKDNENGARLAIDELNASGVVIGGTKITFKLLTEDDAADPKQAVEVAKKLVAANVAGVVGHLNSGTTIPASNIYYIAGIPQISPSSTNPKYTRQGFITAFRLVADDAAQGAALGRYAINTLKVKSASVIDDGTAYGFGLAYEFAKAFESAGGKVVSKDHVTDKTTDFSSVLNGLFYKKPDLIFLGGMETTAGPMLKQMKSLGVKAKFMGGDGICSSELVRLGDSAISNDQVYCAEAGGFDGNAKADFIDFKSTFKAKFNADVQVYAPYVYDAVYVMVAAMVKAGSSDPDHYLPFLAATKGYNGVTGPISFDEKGDIVNGALTFKTVRGGKLETLAVIR